MKLVICALLLLIACSAGGCMFFPPRVYDGSESFTAAHPEYGSTPDYMRTDAPDEDK